MGPAVQQPGHEDKELWAPALALRVDGRDDRYRWSGEAPWPRWAREGEARRQRAAVAAPRRRLQDDANQKLTIYPHLYGLRIRAQRGGIREESKAARPMVVRLCYISFWFCFRLLQGKKLLCACMNAWYSAI